MTQRLFGTDGLRGRVNEEPMTPGTALRLGLAAGQRFRNGARRHRVVIGKDTRLSGYIFEYALTSGFCASGMDVFLVGPMPTPAISFLTRSMRADLGVVISASHNPYMDNGIKLFDSRGYKLPDAVEDEIEELMRTDCGPCEFPQPGGEGRARKIEDSPGRYNVYLKNTLPLDLNFEGLKTVIDCANGAAYKVAPLILEELGLSVVKIGTHPNGVNINDNVGSLHPKVTAEMALKHGADVGIALDGDADRVILVDEKGEILDGDQIMAICADDLMERGLLPGGVLVATVMSNMALEIHMRERGGQLIRTPVGDRYVVEAMRERGAAFGGEQSGHLIFLRHSTTGDGLLAALQVIRIMLEKGKPLSELAHRLVPFPQKLVNVRVDKKIPFDQVPAVTKALEEADRALGGKGRTLLRYSGTESLARVMVEAEDEALVERLCDDLAQTLRQHLK